MKTSSCLSTMAIGMILAGNLFGGGYVSQTDPFHDGIRDRVVWKATSGTTGRFLETGGHLYLDAISDGLPTTRYARWTWKPTYVLINADVLETESLVSIPEFPGLTPEESVTLGIGLQEVGSLSYIVLFIRLGTDGRHINVEIRKEGDPPTVSGQPLPVTANRFYLKLRYTNATGKITFWYRPVHGAVWTKIGNAKNLRDRWGRISSLHVQPYVAGYMFNLYFRPAANIYLDNFRCSNWLSDF